MKIRDLKSGGFRILIKAFVKSGYELRQRMEVGSGRFREEKVWNE